MDIEYKMNERIQQFAEQARTSVPAGLDTVEWIAKYNEIFAKLIVQECIDICDAYGMPDGTSQTAMILSSAIKRKFGIEDVNEQLRNRSTYFGNNP
jgi:hypothetical protein